MKNLLNLMDNKLGSDMHKHALEYESAPGTAPTKPEKARLDNIEDERANQAAKDFLDKPMGEDATFEALRARAARKARYDNAIREARNKERLEQSKAHYNMLKEESKPFDGVVNATNAVPQSPTAAPVKEEANIFDAPTPPPSAGEIMPKITGPFGDVTGNYLSRPDFALQNRTEPGALDAGPELAPRPVTEPVAPKVQAVRGPKTRTFSSFKDYFDRHADTAPTPTATPAPTPTATPQAARELASKGPILKSNKLEDYKPFGR